MGQKKNAGYTLTDSLSVMGTTYVLGHSATNPAPYVTWRETVNGTYVHGNYFSSPEAARQDLFKRAMDLLPEQEFNQLINSFLTVEQKNEIAKQAREEDALADIESCLYDALDNLGISSSPELLLKGPKFRNAALHVFERQDHSYENEALTESLEMLIKEQFPELLPRNFTAMLKISPEEMEMQNDILSLSKDEIYEKYGPFDAGESTLSFSQNINSPNGDRTICLTIFPKNTPADENLLKLSVYPTYQEHGSDSIKCIAEESFRDVKDLEQIFSITDKDGMTWNLDLHADERLRRIGKEFIFNTDSVLQEYIAHNRQKCTVLKPLSADEADILTCGLMWKAKFDDGLIMDVFDYELMLSKELQKDLENNPAQKPSQKPSLNTRIYHAETNKTETKANEQFSNSEFLR